MSNNLRLYERFCLICCDIRNNHNKYYIIDVYEENKKIKLVKKYGRLGKNPQVKEELCPSIDIALRKAKEKRDIQRKKGYKDVGIEDIMMSDGSFFV